MVKTENFLRKIFYITFALFPVATGMYLGISLLLASTRDAEYGVNTYYRHADIFNRYTCIRLLKWWF